MKNKLYTKYLAAPLSMLMILACSPDQYQQKGEYDDVYFTRNDRKKQPEVIAQNEAIVAQQLSQSSSQATVPTELQEKYSNNSGPVTYFEDQSTRVQSARELNYDDFVYDYENENLAYYELPLDWDTDWSKTSFNDLMAQDFQFRMAWYEQYYEGDDWRMRQYLSGRTSSSARNWNLNGPQVGVGMGFNSFGPPGFYPSGMMAVDLNPYGMYDPFWRPINSTFRFSVGVGFGFGNPYYCPPYAPIYTGSLGGIVVINDNNVNINNQTIVRGGRINGTSINSVQTDSQNGAQLRTRSQRIVQVGGASGGGSATQIERTSSGRIVRAGSSARGSSAGNAGVRTSRTTLTADNVRRVNTDAYRNENRTSRGSRNSSRSRVDASQVSTGRSISASSRAGRSTSYTRADITRASTSRNSRNTGSSSLSFDRNSSSSISRSVTSRSSYNRNANSARGFSFGNNSSRSNSGLSRSSGSSFSRGSSSKSSSGSFSRGSSSRSSSSGSSRSSSSSSKSSSSSSGSSRSGKN